MRIAIIYGIIVVTLFFLGAVLDVLGLWLSIRLAEEKKISKSKFFYRLMTIGEMFESLGRVGLIFTPVLFIIEILIAI